MQFIIITLTVKVSNRYVEKILLFQEIFTVLKFLLKFFDF